MLYKKAIEALIETKERAIEAQANIKRMIADKKGQIKSADQEIEKAKDKFELQLQVISGNRDIKVDEQTLIIEQCRNLIVEMEAQLEDFPAKLKEIDEAIEKLKSL